MDLDYYKTKLKYYCKTREDVIATIDQFTENGFNGYNTGYGHSVLDDYNLENDSIIFCLKYFSDSDFIESRIGDIRREYEGDAWECSCAIMKFMKEQAEVWDFLYALLDVPEDIRIGGDDD